MTKGFEREYSRAVPTEPRTTWLEITMTAFAGTFSFLHFRWKIDDLERVYAFSLEKNRIFSDSEAFSPKLPSISIHTYFRKTFAES